MKLLVKRILIILLFVNLYSCGNAQEKGVSDETVERFKQYATENNLFEDDSFIPLSKELQEKAEQKVINYMVAKNEKYTSKGFGEFFEQTYPEDVQKKMNTKEQVKYSLVHSYNIDEKSVQNEYFHLDKDLNYVGQLSSHQMDEITTELLNNSKSFMNLLDSMATDTTGN